MLEPILIDLSILNFNSLFPVIILILAALIIISLDLIKQDISRNFYIIFSVLSIIIDIVFVLGSLEEGRGFFDLILVDGIAILSQLIILIASLFFFLLSFSSKLFHEYSMAEFFALFLIVIAGFMLMSTTNNLMLIFLGLELSSLALYTLIAMHNRIRAIEAAIKYFIMGSLSAGFYVFGVMILYALSASVELNVVMDTLAQRQNLPILPVLVSSIFIMASLGFKLSIIPFHTWTADVYEGSSELMAGFMSVVPKIAAFVVAIRIFEFLNGLEIFWMTFMLYFLSVLTMSLGNIMALVQVDVKRMLAFSSISHCGFVLVAILISTNEAIGAIFLYWTMFLLANFGAFGILWMTRTKENTMRFDHPFNKFSGMIKTSPFRAFSLALFMLALAGIPPFSVFWGKLFLMGSAINSQYFILAVIMAVNNAIAVYYYLKIIVIMFLKEPSIDDSLKIDFSNSSRFLIIIIYLLGILTAFSIFYLELLMNFIGKFI